MADNTILNLGSGGDTVATDDIGGIKHQRVKVQHGADGSATDVSSASPLPIDDAGGSLTVDNAGTFATQATLQAGTAEIGKLAAGTAEIGNVTNSGTFATQATLQTGANAIGKLATNSGVDIGDVDVTSVIPGTGATSLGKAEDAAHTTGDTGVQVLAVRNDDLASLVGADGDYAPLQVTQNGALLMCPAANDDYKYAKIDAATSGNNTLVAAVASRKIRVLALFMVSTGTVATRFEDGAAGTALTGQMNLALNSGFSLPYNPGGWFETTANTLLNLELDAAVSVDGSLTYIEVV